MSCLITYYNVLCPRSSLRKSLFSVSVRSIPLTVHRKTQRCDMIHSRCDFVPRGQKSLEAGAAGGGWVTAKQPPWLQTSKTEIYIWLIRCKRGGNADAAFVNLGPRIFTQKQAGIS